MLRITRSALTRKAELITAQAVLMDTIGVLNSLDNKVSIAEDIQKCIDSIPEFTDMDLAEDAANAKFLLASVRDGNACYVEIINTFSIAYDEVTMLLDTLSDFDGDLRKLVSE